LLPEIFVRARLLTIYAEKESEREAQPHLARCREIIGNGEDLRELVVVVARAEAVVAAADKKFEEAEAYFENAVEIFQRYHGPFGEAEALHYWRDRR
jgi:predicted RNA-binding protein